MMSVWTIAKLTIRERISRFSFWAMAGIVLTAGFIFIPKASIIGMHTLVLAEDSFLQGGNSTWVPMAASVAMAFFLPVVGFAYIHGMVDLDRDTGTMALLQAGGMRRFRYVFGKFFAGFFLMCVFLLVLMCGSLITIFLNFSAEGMPVWSFLSPYLALLPGLLFISAVSLLLETASIFQRKNMKLFAIALFFMFFLLDLTTFSTNYGHDKFSWDFSGMSLLFYIMKSDAVSTLGHDVDQMSIFGFDNGAAGKRQIYFSGLPKTSYVLYSVIFVVAAAILITVIAALIMERRPLEARRQIFTSNGDKLVHKDFSWHPVPAGKYQISSLIMISLKQALGTLNFLTALILGGLFVGSCFVKLSIARFVLLPLIFGFTMLLTSYQGSQEVHYGIDELLVTVPSAYLRQVIASAASGVIICFTVSLPVFLRSAAYGVPAMIVVASCAAALPLVGLLLGNITKTERAFQILLLLFVYFTLNLPEKILPIADNPYMIILIYLLIGLLSFLGVVSIGVKRMA